MKPKVSVIIPCYNQENLIIKALESIPKRDDVEIIVIDDGSIDNSFYNARNWAVKNYKNFSIWRNYTNKGVAYTVNRGYDLAEGEYVVLLGSDDYFYTDKFEECLEKLDGKYDIVYFDLQINNGDILHADIETTRNNLVGSIKFIKRSFLGDVRCPVGVQFGEDAEMHFKLLEKKPKELFTGIVAKHYNFPRENSLCWQEAERRKNDRK